MFLETDTFLPYCNERYLVTINGIFKDRLGNVIETTIIGENKVIRLQWLDGDDYYNVASIIAILKFNIRIPCIYWYRVEAIKKDNTVFNTDPENIVAYRFRDGPIEIREFPGFYYIPYYTEYGINRNLELLNLTYKTLNTWACTLPRKGNRKGGYFSGRAIRDINDSKHAMRHRVSALTFLRYEGDPWKLVLNHRDGIPGNDYIENLEWVTKGENNKHAYDNNLFSNKVVPVLMKNLIDGSITRFPTMASCFKALGRSEGFLANRLQNQNRRYSDNLAFKLDNGSEWIDPEITEATNGTLRPIIVRDIFSNTYVVYENSRKASIACGVSVELIYNRARKETVEAINGFNFRFVDKKMSWPNHSQKHLQIYKEFPDRPSFGILILDKHQDEIAFYTSIGNAAKALKIDEQTLLAYCRSKSYKDGKYFKIYRLTENLGPVIVKTITEKDS